jgi:hypothetical protein
MMRVRQAAITTDRLQLKYLTRQQHIPQLTRWSYKIGYEVHRRDGIRIALAMAVSAA